MRPQQALITDRVAIVTGAAGGIGNAMARSLAAFGADVVIADIDDEGARQTAEQVREEGRRALALKCDVTKQSEIDRMVAATMSEFGRIDIVVNNVGGTERKLFLETDEDYWHEMLDLNLIHAFRTTKVVAPIWREEGVRGSIINVTTIEAYRGAPGYAPYAAAKAGLVNFTKTMALELCPWGIRVNSIAPDATITPQTVRVFGGGEEGLRLYRDQHGHVPMNRRGVPEDYGGAVIFLASDLSAWITGEVIHVGGGTLAASGWQRDKDGYWNNGGHRQVFSGKATLE